MPGFLIRIYIRLSKEYFANFPCCDIDRLLKDVADHLKTDANGKNLYEDSGTLNSLERSYCMGRIKKLIINESNNFISDFEKAYATETLGQYISKRQIKKLVRAFKDKEGDITGYAFVIFHVLFKIVRNIPNYNFDNLQSCINAICAVTKDYCNDYADDPVAHFMLKCYEVVSDEISHPDISPKDKDHFPPIPKRHHNDYNE